MNWKGIMLSEISLPQKDKNYMIPFIEGTLSSQNHKDRKYNGGFQELGLEEKWEVIVYNVSVLQDKKSYEDG